MSVMIRVSSSYSYYLFWVFYGVIAPLWTVFAYLVLAGGIVHAVAGDRSALPVLMAGGAFALFATYLTIRCLKFVRRFARFVDIDPVDFTIHTRHAGRNQVWPVTDVSKVKLHWLGSGLYLELQFHSGDSIVFFSTVFDYYDIKKWGVQAWWEDKLQEVRRAQSDLPEPQEPREHAPDVGDHLVP